ncbi:MAG: sugar phosphate isomerase/epimerase family protein [Verrucomicrobiota bacterium JB023]|nr:sugar phosphate isomerase/epimerase family protein [Verrucomicrobiota bacterium JB023]
MNRRSFLTTSLLTSGCLATLAAQEREGSSIARQPRPLSFALKCGMCKDGETLEEKFQLLKELGYDGVELDSPGGQDKDDALAASQAHGLPIHGVVNSIHWHTRLSDPSVEIREKSLAGLLTAIRECHQVGGTSVLIVPGVVDAQTSHQEAWDRSLEQIARALPLAAQLGIHILIENVWNQMFYDPKGGNEQTAELLARYIDEANSPWLGSYFDIGNHQRFGDPAEWIRTLGKRIVKIDVKDWGREAGFCQLGDGDVDWPEVRRALTEIGFTGWATAEVAGGDRKRCAEILASMRQLLLT